jgi:hypothetical protein
MGHLGESGVACAGCRVRSGGVPLYCPAPVLSLHLPELCRTRSSLQGGDSVLTPIPHGGEVPTCVISLEHTDHQVLRSIWTDRHECYFSVGGSDC